MKRTCFVIMPFSKTATCTQHEWTEVFEKIIQPAVKGTRLGFECFRSQIRAGAFVKDILEELQSADVVIADLTDRNANVFYELGVRHCLQNRTVLISQDMCHVPSDLQPYGVIIYSRGPSGMAQLKRDLSRVLRQLLDDPERADNPVADFLKTRDHVLFQYERVQALRKLAALISETSRNLSNHTKTVGRLEKFIKGTSSIKFASSLSFQLTALNLLVGTNYVVLPDDEFTNAHTLLHFLVTINNQLGMWRQGVTDKSLLDTLVSNLGKVEPRMIKLLRAAKAATDRMSELNKPDTELARYYLVDDSHRDFLEQKSGSDK